MVRFQASIRYPSFHALISCWVGCASGFSISSLIDLVFSCWQHAFRLLLLIGYHGSRLLQDATVLLRASSLESRLFSALRTVCRDLILHKVDSSGRNGEFAPSARAAREHLIASQSRVTCQESTLPSVSRTACRKWMLHKSESCGSFERWHVCSEKTGRKRVFALYSSVLL